MKKFLTIAHISLLALPILLGIFSFASIASAQTTPPAYTVLAPLPCTTIGDNQNCTNPGTTANLSTYFQGIFNLSIGIAAIMAFVLLTVYGFEYMTKDSLGAKMNAKDHLTNVAWGVGLVLFAYLILNTINPKLVSGGFSLVTPQITAPAAVVAGGVNPCSDPTAANCSAEKTAEQKLQANGNILINGQSSYQCVAGSCPTQVAGLSQAVQSGVTALQADCGCTLNITGGSEAHGNTTSGTDPHAAGNAVDIAESPSLDDTISPTPNPSDCQKISFTANGQSGTALYEKASTQGGSGCGGPAPTSTHWHISFP